MNNLPEMPRILRFWPHGAGGLLRECRDEEAFVATIGAVEANEAGGKVAAAEEVADDGEYSMICLFR